MIRFVLEHRSNRSNITALPVAVQRAAWFATWIIHAHESRHDKNVRQTVCSTHAASDSCTLLDREAQFPVTSTLLKFRWEKRLRGTVEMLIDENCSSIFRARSAAISTRVLVRRNYVPFALDKNSPLRYRVAGGTHEGTTMRQAFFARYQIECADR